MDSHKGQREAEMSVCVFERERFIENTYVYYQERLYQKSWNPAGERQKVLKGAIFQVEGTGQFGQRQKKGHVEGTVLGPVV